MYILISLLFIGLLVIYVVQTFLYIDLLDDLKRIELKLTELYLSNEIGYNYVYRCLENLADSRNKVDIPDFMKDRKE